MESYRLPFCAVIALWLLTVQVIADQRPVLGQGNISCSLWLEGRQTDSPSAASRTGWVLGFMSAFNQFGTTSERTDVSEGKSSEELMAWIDNYCRRLEQELSDKVKSVAEKRRNLPPGGQLKEDYVFQWANDGKVGKSVKFSELFADKNTLLLYSFMYGPNWDNPCPSCTSLVDGFDRTWYQVTQSAAFVAIAKAPADRINAWAKQRGWSQIALVSGSDSPYQADYKCQGDSDDMQWPVMHVFRRQNGKIFHFWGTELSANHVDTVWPYWNLMDFTPEGRPDIPTPPQNFRSEFLEKNYLNKE
jgi:predicted dithiol-disulfide oxidoreductase (DUF899 family)